jgi:hypothetical protein
MDIYSQIYEFCKVRNAGTCFDNGSVNPTPRVQFILDLLDKLDIEYELDTFPLRNTTGYNVVLPGSGNKMVTAHHDIVNAKSDNANDNSCSVINAIALKQLVPEITVVLTDGEELGGLGARHLSEQIVSGERTTEWILNLELTGRGTEFFIGCNVGPLKNKIIDMFNCEEVNVPFNDSVIFNSHGIDSVVINPLPKVDGKFDMGILYLCHTMKDSVDKISVEDMKEFTENTLVKIVK